tara:strand:- start:349 stop:1080 length:732 start_codon:yes stop_codon:yes gene_type:complete
MKVKKLNSLLFVLLLSAGYVLADASDNEIFLEQEGDTLVLTIDQVGYGNKFCGTISSGACATDMTITGSNITLNLDQLGNGNQLFGPIVLDSSNIDMSFTGDSNIFDWNIGATGSSDSLDLDLTVSGDSNEWNFDLGGNASAESLNYDLTITTGSSNIFTQVFDSDNNKWELELAGDSNDFNTTQKDADQILIIDYDGDDGNIDIVQQSGSCPQGTTTCSGVIDMEIDSDDAVITINQKDTND